MLNDKWIPSSLLKKNERSPLVIKDDLLENQHRIYFFINKLLQLIVKRIRLKIAGKLDGKTSGILMREFFQELGVLWIKVGQLLSMRFDLFSKEFCEELNQLQDRALGFPSELAIKFIEQDLNAPLERYFSDFEHHPFAAASISQVHRAILKNEHVQVAIKIRRPDVDIAFKRDMAIFRFMVKLMHWVSYRPYLKWADMIWEIERMIVEELDYHYEANNMRRMRKNLRKHKIYVPKVFSRYSSQRILVMELIRGVLMSDYLFIAHNNPKRLQQWQQQNHISPKKIGRHLYLTTTRQILEDNLFHSDLHPGNIILLKHNRLAFIDFGSIGFVEQDFIDKQKIYLKALNKKEYSKMFDIFLLYLDNVPNTNLSELKRRYIDLFYAWEDRTRIRNLPYSEKSMNAVNDEVIQLFGEYRIPIPWFFLRISRATTTLDASLSELVPHINIHRLASDYFKQVKRRIAKQQLRPKKYQDLPLPIQQSLVEFPIRFSESITFRNDSIRRLAQIFGNPTSSISKLSLMFFNLLGLSVKLVFVVSVLFFLQQHEFIKQVPFIQDYWKFPPLDTPVWLGCLIIVWYTSHAITNIVKRLKEADS